MADPSVDTLRQQLRARGYLTHGIERWFALDPWSSRTFWQELTIVALKASVVAAAFGALPPLVVMILRNGGVSIAEGAWLLGGYAGAGLLYSFAVTVAIALALKLRPAIAVDTPAALLAISMLTAALLLVPTAVWWGRFDTPPGKTEVLAAGVLGAVFFVVTTISISAAMLSFSIYELQRVPIAQRRPRWTVMAIGAALVAVVLAASAFSHERIDAGEPMITVRPTQQRLALVAVDGLTDDIFRSRPDLRSALASAAATSPLAASSAAERWASVGTGVHPEIHGVRAIEGIRLAGSGRVLQQVSRGDVILRHLAPAVAAARREPLPPTARRRDYVWEVFAKRGVPAAAVNWWATADAAGGGLTVTGPESIFAASAGEPLAVDAGAIRQAASIVESRQPQFVAVYLPTLDVVLNRRSADRSQQLALSLRALDGVAGAVSMLRRARYDVLLVGLPGDGQAGNGIVAASFGIAPTASAWDAAPTVVGILGFPMSEEMPGRSLVRMPQQPRVASYGARIAGGPAPEVNREYYESLRSLGYIQ